ncbi:uncharacterized protein LY89DRAFT_152619 [Mollisia scopiformis]|uniref:Uncharacterized protein n=1 Tax=Mollisia scopiformis TaxID=149040 RepID=A0A194X248_MOLSC|nr:uncharacterized protein LY89DRAFT_152619 [Mollisia scopiformis]KUJ14074.1 hypothetical protein LY89DRAFT_152619 [Mollisia scopiformis]
MANQNPLEIASGLGTLNTLPPELRTHIWNFVLCFNDSSAFKYPRRIPSYRTALLQTSKPIHAETKNILWRINDFELLLYDEDTADADANATWVVIWKLKYADLDSEAGLVAELDVGAAFIHGMELITHEL